MTRETTTTIGLEDIQGVRLKCAVDGCKERVTLQSNGAVSFSCKHGDPLKILDGSSLPTLLLSLTRPQVMQEEAKKAGFSVMLELSEPVK